ncbi:recombinase family protein [Picosynechococcus sp. PCC 8807]|uniref:recombinase family protein n=1 Tax=Picosynechococcus sp. PCC 8807 TaxID=195248 RepID=UPI000810CC70|nr:recombinase family protein [Picosynechococcus sp. PCC 8807]ANV91209.1 recombinase [Picosynechococcus sp. PCC 8807]
MTIFFYSYSDPLLDAAPEPELWGVEVDRIYSDWGQRQQLTQLLTDLDAGDRPDYLLLRRLDELGDNLSEIGDRLQHIENYGVGIIATEQDYQSDQPLDQKALGQLFQTIGDRLRQQKIQRGHAKNRRQFLPPPGKAPYGYKRGQDRYLIDRSTAPVVKDFCEHFLLFGSLRGAVRHLEQRFGKKIAVSTGRNWLSNPVYRGQLHYCDGTTIPKTHAAILTDNEAAQIDRLLRRNRPLAPRSASAPRCLAGLVQCQTCGSALTISRVSRRNHSKTYLYLRPLACPRKPKCRAIAYDKIFRATVQSICQEFPAIAQQYQGPSLDQQQDQIQQEIQQKESLIAALPDLTAQGIFDPETAAQRRYVLRSEISQLQTQLNQLPPANLGAIAKTITLESFWYDLSEAERRFYLREFIEQIQLHRTSRDDWQIQLKFIFSTSFRYTDE